ncbi:MAG: 50S ribosomal protein L30 [Firmicutes bacterium]|nr:50S ribosomal protein L30 [Bacillota bacterium]
MAVAKKDSGKQLKVTLLKSTNGVLEKQKRTIQALGLKKIRSTAIQKDNDAIRGMIFVVRHMVSVEEI